MKTKKAKYVVKLNDLNYSVEITKKKIKKLIIKVNYRRTILISSPQVVSFEEALKKLDQNIEWLMKIITKQEKLIEKYSLEKFYNNEIIYLNGLKFNYFKKDDLKIKFKMINNEYFYKNNPETTKELIYRENINLLIDEYLRIKEEFSKITKKETSLTIRKMKSRWGSCNFNTAKITINLFLVCVPFKLLQYVIIHEFVHLVHPNHSKNYYALLRKYSPNYKELEKELKEYIFLLT